MIKTVQLLLVLLVPTSMIQCQVSCQKEQARKEIEKLIKKHEEAMPEKEFVEIFDLLIEEDGKGNRRLMDRNNTIKFTFMGGTIFRFYTYSANINARIYLKQRTGGAFEKKEEKTLLDVVKKGDDSRITYYDYEFEEHNDFLLTFSPLNANEGCAILIVYSMVDKDLLRKYRRNVD
ncbi:MAG: hypothetical protein K0B37_10220 [Bacteroidales bacterium]|nr:hypothetical protein [Bacteroidales bacterium]